MTGDPPISLVAGRRVLVAMATPHEYGPALRTRVTPLITGVGPIEAALTTGAALARLAGADALPALVLSLGSAGSRRCPLGTVRQVARVGWRDMDATPLGFAPGETPFLGEPATLTLPTPLAAVPAATLSTGADVVAGEAYERIDAELVDMETYAVARGCRRFGVPLIGLRGVSDGPGTLAEMGGWTALLPVLDRELARAVDQLAALDPAAWAGLSPPGCG